MLVTAEIGGRLGELSSSLRRAGEYVVAHPDVVATHSLRHVAGEAGVAPASLSRLARALGYRNFDDLKDLCRTAVTRQHFSFAEKAEALRKGQGPPNERAFIVSHASAIVDNIDAMLAAIDLGQLEEAADRLVAADTVLVVGALSSAGFAQYVDYKSNMALGTWRLSGRRGLSLANDVEGLTDASAALVIANRHYARRSIKLARMASAQGAYVVGITDGATSPLSTCANTCFVAPTSSTSFFSSYGATVVLLEALVAMVIARSPSDVQARIRRIEDTNHRAHEYWERDTHADGAQKRRIDGSWQTGE